MAPHAVRLDSIWGSYSVESNDPTSSYQWSVASVQSPRMGQKDYGSLSPYESSQNPRPYYCTYFSPSPYPLRARGASASASTRPGSSVHNPILIMDGPMYRGGVIRPSWFQWSRQRLEAFNRPNRPRTRVNRSADGPASPDHRPFVVAGSAMAQVASIIASSDCPDSPSELRTPSRVPPGLVGLHPRFQGADAASPGQASPVYQPRLPGERSHPNSPVYRPASDEADNPFLVSNRVVIGDEWLVPAAPCPSNLTSPAISCRNSIADSSEYGSHSLAEYGDRSQGSGASGSSQSGEATAETDCADDGMDLLIEWSGGPAPTGNEPNGHQPIEVDAVDPEGGADADGVDDADGDADGEADANGVTETDLADDVSMSSISRASTPSIIGQPPIEDYPFLSDLQVQALLEPHRPLAIEHRARFAIDSEAYTRLYHTFARAFVPYCQQIPNEVVNGRIQQVHIFQVVSEEFRSTMRQAGYDD
ncbi:hypothetical protein PtA15_3A108 [Puccinia triticina]|uniref:Uncharacterized protein n=1 Tax=Puccinia triticina TaxID=208348 RepID=A0ABY7CCG9_9BASI|nr:uncharacterized protein PtA15_3A108 [Puccinia triticina]WAQ82744.1 hypothetical protein PtA15_3A108 [Puccinia triticina]